MPFGIIGNCCPHFFFFSTFLQPDGEPLILCFVDFTTPAQAAVALEALQGDDTLSGVLDIKLYLIVSILSTQVLGSFLLSAVSYCTIIFNTFLEDTSCCRILLFCIFLLQLCLAFHQTDNRKLNYSPTCS